MVTVTNVRAADLQTEISAAKDRGGRILAVGVSKSKVVKRQGRADQNVTTEYVLAVQE